MVIFSVYVEIYIKLMTTRPVPTYLDTDVFIQLNYKVCATNYQKDNQKCLKNLLWLWHLATLIVHHMSQKGAIYANVNPKYSTLIGNEETHLHIAATFFFCSKFSHKLLRALII